jgi:hypothetical protein
MYAEALQEYWKRSKHLTGENLPRKDPGRIVEAKSPTEQTLPEVSVHNAGIHHALKREE